MSKKPAEVVRVDLSGKRSQSTIVLQNANPNILEVIENATHVVTYNFEGGKWEKGSCEGACFLTKNCMPPFNTVMILNKMGIENFSIDIDNVQNMKLQAPYVMIKYTSPAGAAKIVGLWFHDEREQHTFYTAMDACKNNQGKVQLSQETAKLQQAASSETNAKTGALKGLLSGNGLGSIAAAAPAARIPPKRRRRRRKRRRRMWQSLPLLPVAVGVALAMRVMPPKMTSALLALGLLRDITQVKQAPTRAKAKAAH
jgi:hypothetical protein